MYCDSMTIIYIIYKKNYKYLSILNDINTEKKKAHSINCINASILCKFFYNIKKYINLNC